ncbi:MAG: hypothetical protein QOJ80_5010 [Mycobacterium sp.]|nr:hypothetical protein [Mycobacterium sp.]
MPIRFAACRGERQPLRRSDVICWDDVDGLDAADRRESASSALSTGTADACAGAGRDATGTASAAKLARGAILADESGATLTTIPAGSTIGAGVT